MATGAEHYRAAENLAFSVTGRDLNTQSVIAAATLAQVHATLALAAATALGSWTADGTLPQPDRMDWWRTASGEPAERKRIRDAEAAEAAEWAAAEAQS